VNIRKYEESDWRGLHTLYNRCLWADKVTPEFFLEHLILSPNFDPAGVAIAEKNGVMIGAAVAQIVRRNLSPWADQVTDARETGYLMPLLVEQADVGVALLAEAENYFRENGRTIIRSVSLGPTLFPNGVDKNLYPAVHQTFAAGGYRDSGSHYSMRCDLEAYRVSESVAEKRDALAREGVAAKVCEYADLPKVRRFLETGDLLGRMQNLADKMARKELHEVIIIASEEEAFGYCQFNYYGRPERVGPFGVTQALRGKGLGQVMVAKLLETMVERGYQYAYFVSCSEQNTHFYAKNNFQVYRKKTLFEKNLAEDKA
jgi:GNAT superfamily N-acetyltransferase